METRTQPTTLMIEVDETWGICPITGVGIRHPVRGKDGYHYEATALLNHCQLKGNNSPITRGLVLPVIYDSQFEQQLDQNEAVLDDRPEKYDYKFTVKELNNLCRRPAQQPRVQQQNVQQPEPPCDSPWIKSGLKAFGTAFTLSFGTYLTYAQFHSGTHSGTNEHTEEDLHHAMAAPIFYFVLLLDVGIRKASRHQFGIFGAAQNAISALYYGQPQPQNNESSQRNSLHMV